jgi:hypothetical protein
MIDKMCDVPDSFPVATSRQHTLEEKLKESGFTITNHTQSSFFVIDGQWENCKFQITGHADSNELSLSLFASSTKRRNDYESYRSDPHQIRIEDLRGIEFSSRNSLDKLGEKLQLSKEFKTKDAAFDEQTYIISEIDDRVLGSLLHEDRTRQLILEFINNDFPLTLYAGEKLIIVQAELLDFKKDIPNFLTRMIALREALPWDAITPAYEENPAIKIAAVGLSLLFFGAFAFTFLNPYPTVASFWSWPWLWLAALIVLGIPLKILIRRDKPRQFRLVIASFVLSFGFALTVVWLFYMTNGYLDRSPEHLQMTVLTSATESRNFCRYELQPWGKEVGTTTIHYQTKWSSCPPRIRAKTPIAVRLRDGFWGVPWLVGIKEVPVPLSRPALP